MRCRPGICGIPAICLIVAAIAATADMRDIARGTAIYEHGYCDQPYVVVTPDGAWLCVFTTSSEREGARSQYIVATRSEDRGHTWSEPTPIEAPDGPEASWAMPLITPFGRVYVFYVFNGDRIDTLPDERPARADMLGWYCYRYSDDGGRTWSARFRLPVRTTACDRANDWGGAVQIMWGIGKPIAHDDDMFFGFTKLGRYMLEDGEGWFFHSNNILTERDPARLHWEMLPEGEHGLRAPEFGSTQEEHNLVPLDNGGLYCIYRTTCGFPVESFSRDRGRTWSTPAIARYANGRAIRNPRACPRLWRTQSGRFLLWFHNHGGTDFRDRNPAWVTGGVEKDGRIYWSQPEILLYGADLSYDTGRFSYPDLIEQDGQYWITTTQKTRASIHPVDPDLLEGLWNQDRPENISLPPPALALEAPMPAECAPPPLPSLESGGFSISLCVTFDTLTPGQVLLDSRNAGGRGMLLQISQENALELHLSDGERDAAWDIDPGMLRAGAQHHITVIVEGAPNIILFIVDGALCDGGGGRQYGWGRFSQELCGINGAACRIAPNFQGNLHSLRMYDRPLRVSQAIAEQKTHGMSSDER